PLGTREVNDAAAVWNGESYVVAWTEVEEPRPYNYLHFARWARVSAGGELIEVFEAPPAFNVGIAANGRNTLVAFSVAYGGIARRLLDRDAHVVREASLLHYSEHYPQVFTDGAGFI